MRRIRDGVSAREHELAELTVEQKHIVAMRALAATSSRDLLFSHWSAAVVLDIDVLSERLGSLHLTFRDPGARGLEKVSSHVFAVRDEEIVEVKGLLLTGIGRTVVDIAGSGTFEDGVVAADSALRAGLPRELLELAVDLAEIRRSSKRIAAVVAFANGDSGSAGESLSRVGMHRMGLYPVLQRKHYDHRGYIGRSDFFFPGCGAVGEFDGRIKFTDPRFAPDGAGAALWNEKVREDRMRAVSTGFARWGWPETRTPRKLAPVLRAAGVRIDPRF